MIRFINIVLSVAVAVSISTLRAQGPQPPVSEIIKKYDADSNGQLSAAEVADSRYARQFKRWDTDKNDQVTRKEIVDFRARFGINEDGTLVKRGGRKVPSRIGTATVKMLPIPEVNELHRVSRGNPPSREIARISAFVLRTDPHPVVGDRYIVVTDHTESTYLESLGRLVKHHDGSMIRVKDLATLHEDGDQFSKLQKQLIDGKAKWVAIAPRMESFRENMLLGMWKLLSTIDDDPQIDVLPGVLLASNETAFAKLIQQSIVYKALPSKLIRPIAISQVQSATELRSLQKAAILRKLFGKMKLETPIVGVYGEGAGNAPRLTGDKTWNVTLEGKRKFITSFPGQVSKALDSSNLIIMHGHGVPGMSCSVDNNGLPADLSNKILFTGSCFSANPIKSDLPPMRQAPGGYEVEQRGAFIVRAIDNGAVMVFGHQRLSSGFPHLFPVLEDLLAGKSAGAAYQELLNGLIELNQTGPDGLVITKSKKKSRVPQNVFLYVLIGDPAIRFFAE